tara:strand:- start:4874 stop:5086 length:213 start_codon:yes stop_codon:yes gene_type:complete
MSSSPAGDDAGAGAGAGADGAAGFTPGGSWCQLLPQFLQRTVLPFGPIDSAFTEYFLEQSGQVMIIANLA